MSLTFDEALEKIDVFIRSRADVDKEFLGRASDPYTRIKDEESLSIGILGYDGTLLALWKNLSKPVWELVNDLRFEFSESEIKSPGAMALFVFENDDPVGMVSLAPEAGFLIACCLASPDESYRLHRS